MNLHNFDWTEEREQKLVKLLSDSMTASQIAAELRGVTRNAVVGKVHRLKSRGLCEGFANSPGASAKHDGSKTEPVVPRRRAPKPKRPTWRDAPIPDDAPPPRMVSLLELGPDECKWPYGDPKEEDFGFCAHERVSGLPYCRFHCARSSGSFTAEDAA